MNNSKTDETLLIELNERIGEAEKARDDRFMQDILADTLSFRRADGTVVNKTTYIEGLLNPKRTYDRLVVSNTKLTRYEGNAAVVSMIVDAAGMRDEKPFAGKYRNIRIFMKEPDAVYGWKCHMWFNEEIAS